MAILALAGASASLLAAIASNLAPVFDSTPYPVAELGQVYRYAPHATDPEGGAVSYALAQAPTGMTLTTDGSSIEWQPSPTQVGDVPVAVRATDGWGAATDQSYTLHVVADYCEIYPITIPQELVANATDGDALDRIQRGTGAGNFSWLSWTGAPDAPTLAASLLPPGDSYRYVSPDNAADHLLEIGDWGQGATGSMNAEQVRAHLDALKTQDIIIPTWDTVRGQGSRLDYRVAKFAVVRLTDYQLTGQGWLSFRFKGYKNCYNDPPVAQPQAVTTREDEALPVILAAADPENDVLTYSVLDGPAHGQLQGAGDHLTYVPEPDYFGPDAFTFRVSDGEFSSKVATVAITVTPVNDPPVADDQAIETYEDTPVALRLLGSDIDSPTLSFRVAQTPTHGSLEGEGQDLTYVPAHNYFGDDQLSFLVNDGELDSAPATVRIHVIERNFPPVATPLELEGIAGQPIAITLAGIDPDLDDLSFRIATPPPTGTLTGVAPNLSFTTDASFSGQVQFSYIANDGRLDSAPAVVTVNVKPANHPPRITSIPGNFVDERATYSYPLSAQDPDVGDVLAYSLDRAVADASVARESGVTTWSGATTMSAGVRKQNLACRAPAPRSAFDPVLKWGRSGPQASSGLSDVFGPPLVAQLNDDNGDGRINQADIADILVLSHVGGRNYSSVVAMSGDTGNSLFEKNFPSISTVGTPAIGDIDGDGRPEIAFLGGSNGGQLYVLEDDGTVKWSVAVPAHAPGDHNSRDSLIMADLDADGTPEIIRGSTIVNNDGTVRCNGAYDKGGDHGYAYSPVVADVDLDGKQELIAGRSIYDSQCRLIRQLPAPYDGYDAIGNFDGDDYPEIVLVSNGNHSVGKVYVFKADGTKLIGPITRKGGGYGGPPTLANVDSDPYPEIGVAGSGGYDLIDNTGALLWTNTTKDYSSSQTGSTFFDFERDGSPEIVYGDEDNVFIWDGRTGALRYKFANNSGTTLEYPTVADVDGDHSADIIVGFNSGIGGGISGGIRVISSSSHSWPDARALWNQHAFSITNINDDGSIPSNPTPSWLAHNSYRLNALSTGQANGQADMAVFDLRLDPTAADTLRMTVVNRGLAASTATVVRAYDGISAAGQLLGTVKVPPLLPNQSFDAAMPVDATTLSDRVTAIVDGIQAVAECLENNNVVQAQVFHARATDRGGLSDSQVFTVGVTDVNEPPAFQPTTTGTPHLGQMYTQTVSATDPDLGDGLIYSVVSAPKGLMVEPVSGEIRWTPAATQAGSQNVTIQATDLRGLSARQTLTLVVPANHAPVITSQPVADAAAGVAYLYDVDATDADDDLLSYRLSSAPTGARISGATGSILWTPTSSQVGSFTISVVVSDPFGGTATQSFQVQVAPATNHPPVFNTAPPTAIALGQRFQYDAHAVDPDGDIVGYTLLDGPLGMAVDTVTGTLVWQPGSDQLGEHTVSLQASDGHDGLATQNFTLLVSAGIDDGNHPPMITSAPATGAVIGATYSYVVVASDLDGDALAFALTQSPAGMTFDAATHSVSWTPTAAQAGLSEIAIEVSDGRGGIATQQFSVVAVSASTGGDGGSDGSGGSTGSGNRPPAITSQPLTQVSLGDTYRYYAQASDPDGDALTFQLLQAPTGMSVNADTGVVAWTPSALQSATVKLAVSDGRGASAVQTFAVTVVSTDTTVDHLPVVLVPPVTDAKAGVRYCQVLQMSDADGDTIAYSLNGGPDGMTVDAGTGEICWTPTSIGDYQVSVRAASGGGYVDTNWTIHVVPTDTPLTAAVSVSPERVTPGGALTIAVAITGAAGSTQVNATLNGLAVSLDADGTTTMTAPTTPGYYTLLVTVTDGSATTTASDSLYVADPTDTAPPGVHLLSPDNDGRVTAPTSVTGEVTGSDVAHWSLTLIDKATGAQTTLAQGDGAIGAGTLATLDPTLSINGFYTLWLQGWDQGGNRAEDFRSVLIDGDMKLGNFSLTFEDVNIPVGGIPIRVTRTYDTRRRGEPLAFGQGWSVDYQSMRVTESRTPGYAWSLVQERNGYFGNWCVRPNGDPLVAVTLPDGKLMKFRAKAMPECQFLTPETDVKLVFEPLPGTDAQLDQTDYQNLRLATVAGSNVYNLIDLSDPYQAAANPNHYRLKLPDGTIYSLTQGVGITQVAAPDGNVLTYTHYGVKSSLGPEVVFARDARDRIEQIILPEGGRRTYTFTGDNDLEMAVDEIGGITSFGYDTRHPHYLRDIVDPRGIRVSRNEYDDDGRLVATIDADGHRIEYTHQLAGRTEIIRDRRGNASIFAYDEEGRVTAESNALGETTLHTYDANGNELTTTDPLGHTTSRTFDPRGNLLVETDPLGHRTVRTYNDRNEVLTQTDPLGRVVATNGYNFYNGKLVSIEDATGALTTFEYDSGIFSGETGELTDIVDAENHHTHYEVNQFGFRTREYDPNGHLLAHIGDLQGREHGQHQTRTRADGTVETQYTRYTLDAKGRITATQHPDGSVTTTDYDGNDKPIKTCDGLNRCTIQEYNARGELAKTTYPDGTWESSDYDENGNVVARTDRGGRTTKMVYDAANRLVTTILPDDTPGTDADNPRMSNEYDDAGRMTASIDARGHRTEYGYDAAGRRTTVTDALGHVTTTTYDAAGQRVAVTDALGRTTRFEYDDAGRLVSTIFPDDTAFDDDNPRVTTSYDKVGRKLSETDEMGRRKTYDYDALGRLVAVHLPNPVTGALDDGALVTRYGYDELGNKVSQTDALGRVTRWSYDTMGRELTRTLPLGQTEHFGYDPAGQRTSHTDFNGNTTGYVYDDAGRLAGIDYPNDADVITTYTPSGQRASVTDGQGTTTYTYDAQDRLTRVSTPDGGVITYAYDAAGNRTGLHSPSLDQTFDFDELNRLAAVHSRVLGGSERVVTYGYDDVGNRATLTQADGTTTTTEFDLRNRLRSLVTRSAAGVALFAATYTVDASGLRTGIDEANAAGPTRQVAYVYDADQRLLSETIARPGQGSSTTSWTYDAVGNRLEENKAGTVTTYTVDANDRLVQTTTGGTATIYTYDANGNTTGHAAPGAMTTYGYDDANRQVSVTTAGDTTTLAYNADGLRIAETRAGQTTTWLLDPNRDYAQTLEAFTGNDLATVWEFGDTLLAQSNVVNGGLHETSLHTDGLGSVRLATNASGQPTDGFEYDAFGNELARTGTTAIDHRYRGEQVDPNTGFYNLRARWMDPGTGRFTTQDSFSGLLFEPASLHKYLYGHSDPIDNLDPSGDMIVGVFVELALGAAIEKSLQNARLTTGTAEAYEGYSAIRRVTFGPYKRLKALQQEGKGIWQMSKQAGEEIHHIIEKRFLNANYNLTPRLKSLLSNPGEIVSVSLKKAEHDIFTKRWLEELGRKGMSNFRRDLDVDDILEAGQRVYRDAPELLRALEMQLL